MLPRDVVAKTFRFEETDVVPYHLMISPDVAERLDGYYGSTEWRQKLVPYIHGWHLGFLSEPAGEGLARDKFGTIISSGNITHVEKPALSEPTLKGYKWPEVVDLENWEWAEKAFGDLEGSFRMSGLGYGLFERSWMMRGFENILVDMMDAPEFVEDLLDHINEIHMRGMDIISKRVPIEAYFGGDDICDQRGPIMGLETWRKLFKPRFAKAIEHCHSLGLPYVMHSCGNVLPLIDDLLEIGLDALESLQPEAMNIFELKRKTEGKMVLMGGLGSQSTLPFGSPEDVRQQTRKLIREMGKGSGYILAPAKPLMPDTPTENAAAFFETAIEQ